MQHAREANKQMKPIPSSVSWQGTQRPEQAHNRRCMRTPQLRRAYQQWQNTAECEEHDVSLPWQLLS
jgi:hypothetical protein